MTTKFYNQFNNGEDFSLNLNDFTRNLVGNVGDRIKLVTTLNIAWTSTTSPLNPFDIIGAGNTLQRTSGSFVTDEFVIDDIITFRDLTGLTDVFIDRTITAITTTTIEFDGAAVALASYTDAILYGKTILTSLRLKFGIIENNEPINFISKIDGTAQNIFTTNAITAVVSPMDSVTGVNSWKESNDSATIKSTGMQPQNLYYRQGFEIEHIFTILPYYQDGELTNLQNLIQPFLFASSNSLRYVTELNFNTTLSFPKGDKVTGSGESQGSVGWFNESLNGNQNFYSASKPNYINQVTLLSETCINAQQKTKVLFDVASSNATFTANTNLVVGISLLPAASDYQQNANNIDYNFLLDDAYTTVGLAPVASSIITNYIATLTNPSSISVEFDVDYLAIDEPRLQGQNYIIWVATCDETLSPGNTDRVTLLLDTKEYIYKSDIEDLMFVDNCLHFPHNVNDTDDADSFDDYKGWIEDGFTIKVPIQLNNDLNAKLETLNVHFSAYNPTTGNRFNLQSYNFSLASGSIVPSAFNPYQAFNIIEERPFNLVSGSQFNKATLTSEGFSVISGPINVYNYEMIIGFKANFEEWIAQLDADTIFYDVNEPLSGLNKKSSRYSLSNGYELIMVIEADVREDVGVLTNYQFLSQPHAYYDYDLDNNVVPDWSVEILTFDAAGTDTSGVINTSENTTVQATFTPLGGVTGLDGPYGIIRLSQDGGNINTIFELSTIRESVSGNLLAPLVGESYTKLTDNGATVVLECLIVGSALDISTNYDISATLRDSVVPGIETELGVLIATELNDIIIIE